MRAQAIAQASDGAQGGRIVGSKRPRDHAVNRPIHNLEMPFREKMEEEREEMAGAH